MKKIYLTLWICILFIASILGCEAKDEYYLYKATGIKVSILNANIEKTITNKNYKIIANDNKGNFYFIPVQLTFWDAINYGKSRIRYENFFVLSTKQVGDDCYLTLSKNYIAPRRKLIVLRGISNKELKLTKINKADIEVKDIKINLEKFKLDTQLSRNQNAEEISGGNL